MLTVLTIVISERTATATPNSPKPVKRSASKLRTL